MMRTPSAAIRDIRYGNRLYVGTCGRGVGERAEGLPHTFPLLLLCLKHYYAGAWCTIQSYCRFDFNYKKHTNETTHIYAMWCGLSVCEYVIVE